MLITLGNRSMAIKGYASKTYLIYALFRFPGTNIIKMKNAARAASASKTYSIEPMRY